MTKRTDLAWGELRTDSGVLLKAGTVDPDSRWFTDGQHIDMIGACRMVITWPYTSATIEEQT